MWTLLPLGWCNFGTLADRLVKKVWPAARVGAVKYYTARVPTYPQLRSGKSSGSNSGSRVEIRNEGPGTIVAGYHAPNNSEAPSGEADRHQPCHPGYVRDSS